MSAIGQSSTAKLEGRVRAQPIEIVGIFAATGNGEDARPQNVRQQVNYTQRIARIADDRSKLSAMPSLRSAAENRHPPLPSQGHAFPAHALVDRLCGRLRDSVYQGLCQKWLYKAGDAAGFRGGIASGLAIIGSYEDDWDRWPCDGQLSSDVNSGFTIQVDVQDKTGGQVEPGAIVEVLNRPEQLAVDPARGQETLNRLEDAGVIVKDNNKLARWTDHSRAASFNPTGLT